MNYTQQLSSGTSLAVTTSSATALPERNYGALKRSQFIINNTSASATVTVKKGDDAAVSGAGIILAPGAAYLESTDGGFTCWQGAVQVVGSAAGTVAIVESFEVR